jgi:predicted transcriptional regulator
MQTVKAMGIKKTIEAIVKEKAAGPTPSFQVFHVIKTLELISDAPVGRGMLAKKLGIGEGATRTLIDRLKEEGIIDISRSGCSLTKEGEESWKKVKKVFPSKIELGKSKLTLSTCNVAILIKEKMERIKLGMEQRDAAFIAGAKGATTLIMQKGKLTMPSFDANIKEDAPELYDKIINSLKPKKGDVIVIGSADTCDKAEYGAIAAAWTLLDDED